METTVHATCILLDGIGILIRGPSGAGKSDLALRLIDEGATLVADDRVYLAAEAGRVMARPTDPLAGKLEVRGLGIVAVDHLDEVEVGLVVDLIPVEEIARLPEPATIVLEGITVPCLQLDPAQPSATAKLRLAVTHNS